MKKTAELAKSILTLVLICGLCFGGGVYYGNRPKFKEAVGTDREKYDLELPFITEKRIVTVDEVEARLQEIGELSTYAGTYTYTLENVESRYLLDKMPILGTKNSIELTCDGIVKIGYELADIHVRIDDDTIYVAIPEAQLQDNYIVWDSIFCSESNSILNPIEFEQYQVMISEIEQEGLRIVEKEGIYEHANENLQVLITAFLAEFNGYKIVYM